MGFPQQGWACLPGSDQLGEEAQGGDATGITQVTHHLGRGSQQPSRGCSLGGMVSSLTEFLRGLSEQHGGGEGPRQHCCHECLNPREVLVQIIPSLLQSGCHPQSP